MHGRMALRCHRLSWRLAGTACQSLVVDRQHHRIVRSFARRDHCCGLEEHQPAIARKDPCKSPPWNAEAVANSFFPALLMHVPALLQE